MTEEQADQILGYLHDISVKLDDAQDNIVAAVNSLGDDIGRLERSLRRPPA